VEAIPHFLSAANAESALRHLLKHPLDRVRALAGRVLASRGFQHSGPHLLDALAEETDPHVQVGLIEALGQLRYRSALRRLLPLIEDRRARDDHRAAACLALGQIGDDMALDPLCKLVDSGAGKLTRMFGSQTGLLVRAAAARALGKFMRHEEARAALRHAADDANPIVRMAVGDALAGGISLTGRDNGPEAPEAPRLAGSLAEISIDQICQLLAGSSKTGLLLLHLEDGVAKVWLDQGMLVAAEFNDAREQSALNTIINRQQGTFVFQPDHEAPEQRTRLPMSTVLLEACRQADEAGR
jgi:hypothetical protein